MKLEVNAEAKERGPVGIGTVLSVCDAMRGKHVTKVLDHDKESRWPASMSLDEQTFVVEPGPGGSFSFRPTAG